MSSTLQTNDVAQLGTAGILGITLREMMHVEEMEWSRRDQQAAVHYGLVVCINLAQGHMSPFLICLELGRIHLHFNHNSL